MASLDLLLKLGFRFNPSQEEVITYYLPRLIAGHPPKDTEGYIHRADVYGADEPRDLAGKYAPVARSPNGDRFFFTGCKRVKGKFSRSAGGGTWVSQSSKDLKNREGIKIGEVKNFRFKKGGNNTDWLMEEYHLCGKEAGGVVEPVVCRIYVSPRAAPDSVAHQESAALPPPQELVPPPQELAPPPYPAAQAAPQAPAPPRQVPVITQQQAPPQKRPAAPVAEPPCATKKMKGAVSAKPMAPQSSVTASAAPPRCAVAPSQHHPPFQTYPTDPFEPPAPAASVTQPSVPATPEQGPAYVPDPADIGMEMDELMSFLDSTPVDGILPSQLFEYDELAKELEDALQGGGEEDGNDNPPRCATPPTPPPPRPASWPAMAPPPPHPPILTFPKDPGGCDKQSQGGYRVLLKDMGDDQIDQQWLKVYLKDYHHLMKSCKL
uniref:NAC domain-containing protein n=1 Tax=Oryza barthii TaxID=65489 RepID=A0A0D3HTS5_9ORYZ